MPLVTITTTSAWNPENAPKTDEQTERANFTLGLGQALPALLTQNVEDIGLEPGTSPEAVQVDFKLFSKFAVNAPDIWVKIEFTENPSDIEWPPESCESNFLLVIRDNICRRIAHWVYENKPQGPYPSVNFDFYWGPGHGIMVGTDGVRTNSW